MLHNNLGIRSKLFTAIFSA